MLVAGVLLLWLSSVLLRGFVKTNPAVMARVLRRVGGAAALGVALFLLLRGELNLALVVGGLGLWLLGSQPGAFQGLFGRGAPIGFRPRTRLRTATLDLALDPVSRVISGVFRSGPYARRRLDDLSWPDSLTAYRWCCGQDPEGARALEAYLDGRFAGWREAADFARDAGHGETGRRRAAGGGAAGRGAASMSDHEAYHVLGLAQGASREEIARAHRRLMKEYHPDHGGSTDMAARVNQAKDVLMRRHPQTRSTL